MSDQWPPPAPDVNKAFKQARDGKNDNVPPPLPCPIVTKKRIKELESQAKTTTPQLRLTPPGVKRDAKADKERLAQIERMKQRLKGTQGKARDDFGRSAEI